ncbi:MAG: tRNA 4-thiouridine(8) synthase ThiI [Succinivibrio sp.]|nr:tRNA 4-thiouridine(8) synthase ThiI [Succinivibrio sp.]
MRYILRLFPEISIKSKPVRNRLIKMVRQNVLNVLQRKGFALTAEALWDKILLNLEGDGPEVKEAVERELCRIPGIHSFVDMVCYGFTGLDDLFLQIKEQCGAMMSNHSFAVRVKRIGVHSFNSQEAERIIGGKLKAAYPNKGVDLSHPEVTVHLTIEQDKVYVTGEPTAGMGGFPVGSQGQVFSLISGGYDSAVSSYYAMRRGCRVNFLFFNMGGTAHELGVKQESFYLWDRYASSHRVRFVTVPFEEIVGQILERVHHGVRGVVLKRMMVRCADGVLKRYHADAMVTGESLAQVSSQTVVNLTHIDHACESLIIRPLVTMDKQEIIDVARKLGTAHFAESMPEYCGVISDHPNVQPSRQFVEEEEAKLDKDLVERALERLKTLDIAALPEDTGRLQSEVEVVSELGLGEVVLDVRAPDEAEAAPLMVADHEVMALPFYKVAALFPTLEQSRKYALYCAQGVMSLMQARQLKELGFHNVRVYRPQTQQ